MIAPALAVLACPPMAPIQFKAEAAPRGTEIRLADVAELGTLPPALKDAAATLVIARATRSRALDADRLVRWLRLRLPRIACWLPKRPPGVVRISPPTMLPTLAAPAGGFAHVEPAVEAGGDVLLVVREGPVAIERRVTALQPAQAGQRLFVRDADGAIYSSRFAGADR